MADINNTLNNMYDTDDFVTPTPVRDTPGVIASPKGMVTVLDLDGKKIDVVNPEYIKDTSRTITDLRSKLQSAQRDINILMNTMRKLNQRIQEIDYKLDRKIDRL